MGKNVNRAKMQMSGTPGTGTITLNGAVTGYDTFAGAGVADGELCSYVIEDGAQWEYGYGTYTASGTTFARTTCVRSSDGTGTKISVNNSGNQAVIYLTPLADDIGQDAIRHTRQTISYSHSIPDGCNGHSVGPITIASGFAVTVPSGSIWLVE